MRAAFFHDSKLKYDENGNYYTSGSLNYKLFKRYLDVYDELTIVTRCSKLNEISEVKGYSTSNTNNVKFVHINKLNPLSLFFGKDNKKIAESVRTAHTSIIRMPSIVGIAAYFAAMKLARPVVIEMVGCPWDALWNYGKIKYKICAPFLYLINRVIIWNSNNVVYVTEDFLQKRYPTSGKSIACSDVQLPCINISILEDRLLKQKKYGENTQNKYVLATIANTGLKYKGQHYVIRAISKLNKKGFNLEYHLIGAGDITKLKEIAKKYNVEKNIRFVGPLEHSKVLDYFKNIDIYIQPSNVDATPRVVLEAFNMACPVIGSSSGGIPELLDNKYVFKRKNVDDLVKKIENLIRHDLTKQSKLNFKKAMKYQDGVLNSERSKFLFEALDNSRVERL